MIGSRIIELDEVDSTNSYARKLARSGVPHGTVVRAEQQAAGRGREGRLWVSPPGDNLYLSIILFPEFSLRQAGIVALLTPVAVEETISSMYGMDVKLKWPNDLLVNEKKISGILIELAAQKENIDYMIVGIGVNLNTGIKKDSKLAKKSTSVREETGSLVPIEPFCEKLLDNFEKWYEKVDTPALIIRQWKKSSCTIGKQVTLKTGNMEVSGKAVDITGDGALLLETSPGIFEKISSGEIIIQVTAEK